VCEANASIDGGFDSVPHLPKGLGKERVGEAVEVAQAYPPSAQFQRGEVEAPPKQEGQKRLANKPH